MRRITILAAALILLAAPALGDLAGDRRDCANTKLEAEARVAACTRLIDSGAVEGRELAGAYISRGDGRDDLDQHAQAILDYDLALELDPGDPRIYRYRAYSRTRLDQYQEAIPDFDKAIELDPRSAWSYRWRGAAYARLKDYEKAMADYDTSLELDPRAVDTYSNRGYLRVRMGDNAGAVEDFDQVLSLKPYRSAVYSGRGKAHEELGNTAQAIHDSAIAILLNPNLGSPEWVLERLVAPAGAAAPGPVAYAPPRDGLTVSYIQVVTTPAAPVDEMEAAIGDLINFFKPSAEPLPRQRTFMVREIGATEDGVTSVEARLKFETSQARQQGRVTHFRAMWPTVMPMGQGPTAEIAYDRSALDGLWPLEAGKESAGGGAINMICPDEVGPVTMMFQCQAGERIPLGKVTWSARVAGWEEAVVPAGVFPAYVIEYEEMVELEMFHRPMKRGGTVTWWYAPEVAWWVKRTRQDEENLQILEADAIE